MEKPGPMRKALMTGESVLEIVELLRRFVSVKLDAGQLERVDKIHDHFRFPIDEDADGFGGGSEMLANFPSVGGSDGALRFFVKIQADGVGAEFFGEAGILRAGNAADFDAHVFQLVCPFFLDSPLSGARR